MIATRRPLLLDVLLVVMTVIWGTNYSIIKTAFREVDPQAFNAARMTIGSVVFLAIMAAMRLAPARYGIAARDGDEAFASIFHTPAALTPRDWLGLIALGAVGHCIYQYCFIEGLSQTSVANSALILAATPVIIALVTAALGLDRIGPLHWAGALLSVAGIYIIAERGAAAGGGSAAGDLLMVVAVCCWAAYTIGARPLMVRHSPVGVTGLSMAIGTLLYVPLVWPHVRRVSWAGVSAGAWTAIVYSALFALCVAYTIWYAAVRAIGSARTAVYSNVIPIVAMATAVVFLGEPLGLLKIAGAAAVLVGVALTRIGRRKIAIPAQE